MHREEHHREHRAQQGQARRRSRDETSPPRRTAEAHH
jgi:hypothetical protein